jgi:hypothetical protein
MCADRSKKRNVQQAQNQEQAAATGAPTEDDQRNGNGSDIFRWIVICGPLVGMVGLITYSIPTAGLATFAVGTVVSAASASIGAFLGFLFGIPREISRPPDSSNANNSPFVSNTNLEQVSDWLTKILVGVGLVQIGALGANARRLSRTAGDGLRDDDTSRAQVVGFSLIVLFAVWGFLVTYLASRTLIRKFFARSLDEEEVRRITRRAALEAQEQALERSRSDADAFALTDRVLKHSPGTPPVTQAQLTDVVKRASERTRAQIFSLARNFRSINNQPAARGKMKGAGIVFQALIDADPEGSYHRPRAELGYVLKDSDQPDWVKAEEYLSAAIDIRNSSASGEIWPIYEFNRAKCRIKQDSTHAGHSTEAVREKVLEDLRVASIQMENQVASDDVIREWLNRNEIGLEDITSRH